MLLKNIFKLSLLLISILLLNACASIEKPRPTYPVAKKPLVVRKDTIHIVAPGENLELISSMYDVSIEDIINANAITKRSKLLMGQQLLIPNAIPIKSVIPLFPSYKWKYIIIHHSATDEGNALSFHYAHKLRGFNSLGYHFVIDNGTDGKKEGHIEASGRWLAQQNGAHCKASNMNLRAIGICLVGNFSKDKASAKQLESLVYLVKVLKKYYKIPTKRILGHGKVPGAKTECPGNYFPWKIFYEKLLTAAN